MKYRERQVLEGLTACRGLGAFLNGLSLTEYHDQICVS